VSRGPTPTHDRSGVSTLTSHRFGSLYSALNDPARQVPPDPLAKQLQVTKGHRPRRHRATSAQPRRGCNARLGGQLTFYVYCAGCLPRQYALSPATPAAMYVVTDKGGGIALMVAALILLGTWPAIFNLLVGGPNSVK